MVNCIVGVSLNSAGTLVIIRKYEWIGIGAGRYYRLHKPCSRVYRV